MQRIADRVGRDPWLSGFTGLLAQLLFIPVLVLTIVILAVSIIGIPLLLLVPFVILGFLIATLVGFSGVALRIGRWAVGSERPPFVALAVGIVLVSAVALVARTLALLPVPLWPISWILGFSAFLLEYLAWTVGLGAALLTRFGTRGTSAGRLKSRRRRCRSSAGRRRCRLSGAADGHSLGGVSGSSSWMTRSKQLGQMPWLNCTSVCSAR